MSFEEGSFSEPWGALFGASRVRDGAGKTVLVIGSGMSAFTDTPAKALGAGAIIATDVNDIQA